MTIQSTAPAGQTEQRSHRGGGEECDVVDPRCCASLFDGLVPPTLRLEEEAEKEALRVAQRSGLSLDESRRIVRDAALTVLLVTLRELGFCEAAEIVADELEKSSDTLPEARWLARALMPRPATA